MSKQVTRQRGPKRSIEKRASRLDISVGNSISAITLHAPSDPKTLVRTIIKLNAIFDSDVANVAVDLDLLLHVAPNGTDVVTPIVGQSLDQDESIHALWRDGSGSFNSDATGAALTQRIEADLKSMRIVT